MHPRYSLQNSKSAAALPSPSQACEMCNPLDATSTVKSSCDFQLSKGGGAAAKKLFRKLAHSLYSEGMSLSASYPESGPAFIVFFTKPSRTSNIVAQA